MAEPLDQEELALFLAHLQKFPEQESCPICKTKGWRVVGVESAIGHHEGERNLQAPSMPVVQVMCRTCFYIRAFAWIPVQRMGGRDV